MSKIGYIRVSTFEQKIDRQLEQLEICDKVFVDKISGGTINRPELVAMLDYIREGDIVVCTELDRLGRNNKDLTNIMNQILQKGATLEVLNLPQLNGIQDENLRRLLNNLIMELYKYQAESERARIKERQRQGIQLAKEKGKYKGRKKKFTKDDPKLKLAIDLYLQQDGFNKYKYTLVDIEKSTGISRRTLSRYLKELEIARTPK
ncbi:recombinase family protein [Listeria monocytogenes]|nr:recombinase family protein [Listeria monocytogenes]EAF0952882.1 recombinase family protein [Listeria monocytogenes]EAF1328773.1 recombinase family protein [Listeria monocytogenes]EAF1331775.1 recombinase family protein [Listeria monocytogenes]EAG9481568.1 recombinase family protein [Listeria monocytogenes]